MKFVALIGLVIIIAQIVMGKGANTGPAAIVTFTAASLWFMGSRILRPFAFTIWVFTAVVASMYYPAWFGTWFGFDLKFTIVPLIQIIMFGMGTTLSITDFARVVKMPYPVLIGMVLQFTVMPFSALGLALLFGFEPEVAAGVVLIGSCPGGVASNLMAYLARGRCCIVGDD